ncbi:hypothetical protein [Streptomyces sp. NPDC005281]|uniref:hypothetical protein n=1 Tax=Streptomyces sp. NPDC005281 TaxID=3155712 RepID=UPI0033BDC0D9
MTTLCRALASLSLAAVALVGCSAHTSEPKPPRTHTVTSFNDGFSDSKRDDCEQGFKPACAWLVNNH